jgi:hypothetical protein
MTVSETRRVLKISRHPISLDRPVGESEDSYFGDFIEDEKADNPVESATQEMLKDKIEQVLKTLTYREREIIKLRYGIGDGYTYTLEEVCRIFKVTPERVRQVEAKAIRKLQHPVRARKLEAFLAGGVAYVDVAVSEEERLLLPTSPSTEGEYTASVPEAVDDRRDVAGPDVMADVTPPEDANAVEAPRRGGDNEQPPRVTESMAERDDLPRYLAAKFPDQMKLGDTRVLEVRLALNRTAKSASVIRPNVPTQGAKILVYADAPPEFEIVGEDHVELHVPFRGDSTPGALRLKAIKPGHPTVSVRAFQGGTYLGELQLNVSVDAAIGASSTPLERRADLEDIEEDPGELTLVIHCDTDDDGREFYRYQWIGLGETLDEVKTPKPLQQPRKDFIDRLVVQLNELARDRTGYSAATARRLLKNIGIDLWDNFIPPELLQQFVRRRDGIKQISLMSDGDPVPWELMFPPADSGLKQKFFAEQYDVVRRRFGPNPARRLRVSAPCFVLPPKSPQRATEEVEAIRHILRSRNVDSVDPIDGLDDLLPLLERGEFDLLHFACHNAVNFESFDVSTISMKGGKFRPIFLNEHANRWRARAPVVFMNACRTDAQGPLFTSTSGWAPRFLGAGAGAFIGSLWEVRDVSARRFAEAFYTAASKGGDLRGAVQAGRTAIAREAGDPTWLAYAVYGDPNATFTIGGP